MKNRFSISKFGAVVVTASFGASVSFGAIDPSTIALDTSPVEVLGLTILGALAVIWVARKVVSFLGR